MTDASANAKMILLEPARGLTISDRIRRIQPYEVLIFFILVVLLALCLFVSQVVVQDVDEIGTQDAPPPAGLNAAFVWGE